jgi:PAS domain S-box-containing protein
MLSAMFFKEIHKLFPFPGLLRLLLALAVVLQFIIISQMYFFRADLFSDPVQLFIRLFRGVVLSFLAGFILAYPCLALIRFLNEKFTWKRHPVKRFLIQFPFAMVSGIIITPLILLPASVLFNLEISNQVVINNAYYLVILSFFLMTILEAWIYFNENISEKVKAVELENKLFQEGSEKALMEERSRLDEEKNRLAQQMVEEEKALNQNLNNEIQKREEITRQLHESREQLQSLLSHLMGAVYRCRFDENYTMEYISGQILDITGFPPTDFIDNSVRSFASVVHPDDLEMVLTAIEENTKARSHFEVEYRIIHKEGGIVWVRESGRCIFGDDGDVAYLDGIIVDVTRRKEAELAVKDSERNYKDLMDFLPQPVFELNLEGRIMFSNKAGDDFFGKLPDDPNSRPLALSYFIEEDRERIIEKWQQSSKGLPTEPGEFTAIKGDGSQSPVMIFGNPIYHNGRITGRRGIIIDISERKKYEMGLLHAKQELEQVNNNLEQMVAERTRELMAANDQLLKVQKENLQSQFEILRQQINPHFLFNSLNVLSGLISKDASQAQLFIDEFSHIYRYVLETMEQPVSTLRKELDFMRSYLYLQQMRHGEDLTWTVNIPAGLLDMVLPPLSLQVVLENALKHNIVNEAKPLQIEIFAKDKTLMVKNRLQPKISKGISTGLGLKNLVKRYALISNLVPIFTIENNHYVATLPLINIENDERTDR